MHLLLADENFSAVTVEELRSFGYDILTLKELGLANRSFPDEEVLAKASMLRRVLLTFNRNDFIQLHKKSADHAGIIVCRFFSAPKELAIYRFKDEVT